MDTFIVPPPKDAFTDVAEAGPAGEESKPAKTKGKGKGKAKAKAKVRGVDGTSTKTFKTDDDDDTILIPVETEPHTADENAQRERVGTILT